MADEPDEARSSGAADELLPEITKADWDDLLANIRAGACTPFIGAGASIPPLPLGSQLAQEWAEAYEYPLADGRDLARVAQYLSVQKSPMFPKTLIVSRFQGLGPPDFQNPVEPHGLLADLPLPVYITTNYDDFMMRALKNRGKDPQREVCRWNREIQRLPSVLNEPSYQPSVEQPLVFHLHGHTQLPRSIVLSEDDYIDFLMNLKGAIPPRVEGAFSDASVLFLGYRLADVNFRLLFRTVVHYMEMATSYGHVSVQLLPEDIPKGKRQQALDYLNNYYEKLRIHVYWGSCQKFTSELRNRWDARSAGAGV
ncbi:MAG TPA: SIR2 family protein [Bryobacteraceae bacterium]|nr:SIR2 family protein [Bryobacteraceae bacterium]